MELCRICGGVSKIVAEEVKGYQEGLVYKIFECQTCKASFSYPNTTSDEVYNLIYQHANELVGYERYQRLAELVRTIPSPLQALAVTEPAYWAVINSIKQDKRHPSDITVLEVGCGLGYLTYALRKTGYQAIGIDIAYEAITSATDKFGNFFKVANLFDLPDAAERYDYVVMMEVIEHVPNPKEFIAAAVKLLKPQGRLLVTTPNKSAAPKECNVWQSDMPPVHLWFLAESSIESICDSLGHKCSFVDFTDYTKKFFTFTFANSLSELQQSMPRFMKDGQITAGSRVPKSAKGMIIPRFLASYIRRRLKEKQCSTRTITLCSVITE